MARPRLTKQLKHKIRTTYGKLSKAIIDPRAEKALFEEFIGRSVSDEEYSDLQRRLSERSDMCDEASRLVRDALNGQ